MKKILAGISAGILIMAGLISCQDTLEEQYVNPEQTSEASIAKFLTKMIDNDRVRPSYWNVRTFLAMHPAVYTQSVSYTNSPKRYQQQASYADDFWRDYYTPTGSGIVAHMREIEKAYASLPADEKANADVFVNAAKIIYYDQTSQMVDLWGDIPFSQAGLLNLNGEIASPEFDNAAGIYDQILTGLESAASYFATASVGTTTAASFAKQDILFKGSMSKWARYANSLRLRLLMRISFQNEAKAKADILKMLADPATYPLIDEAAYNATLDPLTTYTDNMRSALTELNSHVAPEFLLETVLKPAGDPRIRVLFDKNVSNKIPNADYYGMPANITSTDQEKNISAGKYAVLDSTTFLYNTAFPGIVMTSAEVNFLKAEAYQRWGSTVSAQTAYEKGVTQAVEFSFYLNQTGAVKLGIDVEDREDELTAIEITTLLASTPVAYIGTSEEKLAKIGTQKWLSFGFIQSIQSWAETRRTGYPVLTFVPDNSTPGSTLPPSRLLYTPVEKTYNAANYAKVSGADLATNTIFWDVK